MPDHIINDNSSESPTLDTGNLPKINMPFVKGQKPPPGAGRRKGSKNVKTLLSAAATLALAGRNPIDELIALAYENPKNVAEKEFNKSIWIAIQPYCEAPQKEPLNRRPETPLDSVANAERVADHLSKISEPLDPATATPVT